MIQMQLTSSNVNNALKKKEIQQETTYMNGKTRIQILKSLQLIKEHKIQSYEEFMHKIPGKQTFQYIQQCNSTLTTYLNSPLKSRIHNKRIKSMNTISQY
jgi:hypothetical protein